MDTVRCVTQGPERALKEGARGCAGCGPVHAFLSCGHSLTAERGLWRELCASGQHLWEGAQHPFLVLPSAVGDTGRVTPKGKAGPEQVMAALGMYRVVPGCLVVSFASVSVAFAP